MPSSHDVPFGHGTEVGVSHVCTQRPLAHVSVTAQSAFATQATQRCRAVLQWGSVVPAQWVSFTH